MKQRTGFAEWDTLHKVNTGFISIWNLTDNLEIKIILDNYMHL